MIGPLSRLILRYIIGAMVMYGMIGAETGEYLAFDPDLSLIIGGVLTAIVEGAYALAKRRGWAT